MPFVTKYVPYQYETKQIFDKAIVKNGTLESVPDCYKN